MLTAIGGNIPRQPSDWYDTECAPDRQGSWRLTPAHSTQGFYSDANTRHLVNFAAARDSLCPPSREHWPPGHRILWSAVDPGGRRDSPPQSPWTNQQPLEPTHTLFDDPTQALRGERLKGVEAVAWSSTITTPDLLFYHLLPRLLVIAEAAWHGEESPPWDKPAPLIEHEMAHLRRTIPYWNPQRPR